MPLSIATSAGALFCIAAIALFIAVLINIGQGGHSENEFMGFAGIVFFVGGIQLLCAGILGKYMSKMYLETKHRPIYILSETSEEEA